MKTMTVGEFKAQFSEVIAQVKAGEEIAVTFGRKKEVVGYFMPQKDQFKSKKRVLGILEGKATAAFNEDFEITEEEFLGL
ncbi:type II toxin-antitoxin system Phd/YefM family antitoxin [Dyadobacter psychrotolerans]|uniref:Prevent-host-death protein n=1 Tax=Dyadobacter psychrotolerans TaxID=2541721 RepID=A0A4R5DK48_9BACT|nr:prevent-host-death protein [Dyadobacter psychrotolerans]TDE14526.1 prevent-host-death protein [Dyadobacter psychrotolerans]